MKKALTVIILSLCTLIAAAQSTVKHEVATGETLSSIARSYGTSVKELLKLNPSLNPDYVMAGQKINVPASNAQGGQVAQQGHGAYKTTHVVQKKETIFSVSRLYGITEDALIAANPELKKGKLKKGAVLKIPYTDAERRVHEETARKEKAEADERRRQDEIRKSTIHAAVILPFALGSDEMTSESAKMANLYQGFLLAVDTLKRQGYNVNVYAYDESGQDINTILGKPMMKNMSLIVGPMKQGSIAPVADFAKSNGIAHVVPMSSSGQVVSGHPTTFQVNTPNSLAYSQVAQRFLSMHRNDNVIFLAMNDASDNASFTAEMKRTLENDNVFFRNISLANISSLVSVLSTSSLNVIVPSASSAAAFNTLCSRLASLHMPEGARIQLFGYPEWQVVAAKQKASLAKYNCQFFTSFYHNETSQHTRTFESHFASCFHQPQYNALPRYGELGFDIGMFFLKGLREHGKSFVNQAGSVSQHSLEFPMQFERQSEGSGWVNRSLMIVTYKPDGSVTVK